MANPKLKDRIREALGRAANKQMVYADLARVVFPEDQFPRAFQYQASGGPPGCYMSLSRAIREMREAGEVSSWSSDVGPGNRHVALLT